MTLTDAIRDVARQPASIPARARLAAALDALGVPAATGVYAAAARAAAARGQFFAALTLVRQHLAPARQREMLTALATRFGADRPRGGRRAPPPLPPAREVAIPVDEAAQVELALKVGGDLTGVGLPDDAQVPAVPLFSELPPGPFVALAQALEAVPLAPGDVLVTQGKTDRAVYLLARGTVRVSRSRPGGGEAVLAEVSAPALVGEMALLTAVPRRATVTAVDDGLAWRIDGDAVATLAVDHPGLVERLAELVKRRLLSNLALDGRVFGDDRQRDALLAAFQTVEVPRGAEVIARGAAAPGLFVVLHGEAEVLAVTGDGEPVRVAVLAEADVFGERSLITGEPTTASVRMPEGGVVLHLPVAAWRALRGFVPGLEAELAALADVRHGELLQLVRPVEGHFEPVDDAWVVRT